MKKLLALSLVLTFFSLLFVRLLSTSSEETTSTSEEEQAQEGVDYKIIKQDAGDSLGRTVVYEERGTFDGAGTVVEGREKDFPFYLVGEVTEFSQIGGSSDYQITLRNPLNGDPLETVRLVVDFTSELGKQTGTSFLHLERLDQKGFSLDESGIDRLDRIEKRTLEKAVKPGDVVAIVPFYTQDEQGQFTSLTDDSSRIVARLLVIRRFGPILDQ